MADEPTMLAHIELGVWHRRVSGLEATCSGVWKLGLCLFKGRQVLQARSRSNRIHTPACMYVCNYACSCLSMYISIRSFMYYLDNELTVH